METNSNLCISCFKEKNNAVCEHCGYEETEKRKGSFLPACHILNNRYIVGEILEVEKNNRSYKAYDMDEKRIVEIQEYFPCDFISRSNNTPEPTLISQENEPVFLKNTDTLLEAATKMMAFVNNESIIHVFDAFKANGTAYIVLEYVEGMTVSDYLNQCGGSISEDEAIQIITKVLDGLNDIHKQGLVHRDITSHNVIITTDNKVKIIKFRFLKDASPYKDEEMTVHFVSGYAPPEQYRHKSKQGAFTDIYSVGALLYRMIIGKRPMSAITRNDDDSLHDMRTLNPDISDHVALSVLKALNVDPNLRFKSVIDFKKCILGESEIVDVSDTLKKIKDKKQKIVLWCALAALGIFTALLIYLLNF